MKTFTCLLVSLSFFNILIDSRTFSYRRKSTEELITEANYHFERHQILTKDGYFLTLHRIPSPDKTNPLLLVPALPVSGSIFVTNLIPNTKPMAFLSSELGYDTWILHHRGSRESSRHTHLKNTDKKYWEFTLHELAIYDVAETVDYILRVTRVRKLYFLGPSQAASVFFILLSTRPEYNDKLKAAYLIVPAGSFMFLDTNQNLSIVKNNPDVLGVLFQLMKYLNIYYLPLCDMRLRNYLDGALQNEFLNNVIMHGTSLLIGKFEPPVNFTHFTKILLDTCTDVSLTVTKHYIQVFLSQKFTQYDYGLKENLRRYGRTTPSIYNLSLIDVPITLASTDSDILVSKQDVEHLNSILKNSRIVTFPGNHINWAVTPEAINKMIEDAVKFMKMY